MAGLEINGGEIRVLLSRWEQLGALSHGFDTPLSAARSATVTREPHTYLRGLRAPGTALPRLMALGTWRRRDGRDFTATYRRHPEAVVIELDGARFDRLIVSGQGLGPIADEIEAAAAR